MLALATLLLYLLSCLDFTETNASGENSFSLFLSTHSWPQPASRVPLRAAARREYQLLYGHVLAETLPPGKGSTPPSDVAVAVQVRVCR